MTPILLALQKLLHDLFQYIVKINAYKYKATDIIRPYNAPGNVTSKDFNAIEFSNEGNVVAKINETKRIAPGETWGINHLDPRVTDDTPFVIKFDFADPDTTGTNMNIVVTTTNITIV